MLNKRSLSQEVSKKTKFTAILGRLLGLEHPSNPRSSFILKTAGNIRKNYYSFPCGNYKPPPQQQLLRHQTKNEDEDVKYSPDLWSIGKLSLKSSEGLCLSPNTGAIVYGLDTHTNGKGPHKLPYATPPRSRISVHDRRICLALLG